MPRPRKRSPAAAASTDREFEDLLRRAARHLGLRRVRTVKLSRPLKRERASAD